MDETITVISPVRKTPVTVVFSTAWADGQRFITTCTIHSPGSAVVSGSAICSPRDRIDRGYGQSLAFKRAILDGLRREVPIESAKETRRVLAMWRHALWQARNPNGWKQPEPEPVETPAGNERICEDAQSMVLPY